MKIKNVSKLELKNSLLETLSHNDDALDYIQNAIYNTENILGLDPLDKNVQARLNTEKYIQFSLKYLDTMYSNKLKELGVKL